MKKILAMLDNRNVYVAVTVAALVLSVAVMALMLLAGDVVASDAPPADGRFVAAPSANPPTASVPSEPPAGSPEIHVEVSDRMATELLAAVLHGRLDTTALAVSFHAPDELRIAATLTREALSAFLKAEGVPLSGALMLFAPKVIDLDMTLGVAYTGADGLSLETRTVTAGGFNLTEHLPDGLLSMAGTALQSAIPDLAVLRGVSIEDGRAVLLVSVFK